jgi:putative redox protein
MKESSSATVVRLGAADKFRATVEARQHTLIVDEPPNIGGTDAGMTPYELIAAAVGACTAITLRMYADRKGWPLESVEVHVRHGQEHAADCVGCDEQEVGVPQLELTLDIAGELNDEQRARLHEIAARCPVKQTLERGLKVVTPRDAGAPP